MGKSLAKGLKTGFESEDFLGTAKKIIQEGMPALSEIGVLGDPTKASAEKGAVYLEKTVEFLIEEIKKQLE